MDPTDLPDCFFAADPYIPTSAFVAPGTQVLGEVRCGEESSIWYNAVARGDINHSVIGARSNIQDGCILHVTNDLPCIVGDDVTIGHGVKLPTCTVEDGCLIGIGAIVLSGAHVGRGCIVGAGAVVHEDEKIDAFSLVVGVPARLNRVLPEDTYAGTGPSPAPPTREAFELQMQRLFEQRERTLGTVLATRLPRSLVEALLHAARIDSNYKVKQLDDRDWARL